MTAYLIMFVTEKKMPLYHISLQGREEGTNETAWLLATYYIFIYFKGKCTDHILSCTQYKMDQLFRYRPQKGCTPTPTPYPPPPPGHGWPLQMADYTLCLGGNITFFLNNAIPLSCYLDSETWPWIAIWSFINCFTPTIYHRGQPNMSTNKPIY